MTPVSTLHRMTRRIALRLAPLLLRGPYQIPTLRPIMRGEDPTSRGEALLGWGAKPSGNRAKRLGAWVRVPSFRLEDGFLRSYGFGSECPPLSLVVDDVGIYYDCTGPSALENLLNSSEDLLAGRADEVARARQLIVGEGLSKYNCAPPLNREILRRGDDERVLVVDQTFGDLSVTLGGASAATFHEMLAAARRENPSATLYVKTHPVTAAGARKGYLTDLEPIPGVVILREALNPQELLAEMDRVYVVTSTLGFEALLAGRPVSVFGRPWYAGWGVTQDRQSCARRTRERSVDELLAAAYLRYARYLNPFTGEAGTFFDVAEWLILQRQVVSRLPRGFVGVGLNRMQRVVLGPLLSMAREGVAWAWDGASAIPLLEEPGTALAYWGVEGPPGTTELPRATGVEAVRMEDGFYRSVGLGSDLIPPRSIVLDRVGLYFDPRTPSELEEILQAGEFSPEELAEAGELRQYIVRHHLTKYNVEPWSPTRWNSEGRPIVLVPGQVEDDASIRFGCDQVSTNLGLLEAVRAELPDAWIVYKPHPDVLARNRRGHLRPSVLAGLVDHVEARAGISSCLAAADQLHTMTSTAGFEALLSGKCVTCWGRPFYAGWGLTEDRLGLPRRTRSLSLDELVAGVLLRYPLYWDPTLRGFTRCGTVLNQLRRERDIAMDTGRLHGSGVSRLSRTFGRVIRFLSFNLRR